MDDFSPSYYKTIKVIDTFSERTGNVFLGAAEGMVGISPFYQFGDLITEDIQAAIDDAFAGMADGTLNPCLPAHWESDTGDNCTFGGAEDLGTE
jgi:basic membrane lipoprotein Med (substrate-binding protein (PBP1-ABC) superfamily)